MAGAAFDEQRTPPLELIEDCVHCGFCLPTCPTYTLWGEEMDSPRGRIVLMKAALEDGAELSDPQVTAWDNCLGCMACVTSCPSGVRYDTLIARTRAQVERNYPRTRAERAFRRAVFELFTHPGRLRALVPLASAAQRAGLPGRLARSRLGRRLPLIESAARLAPDLAPGAAVHRLAELTPARGERRGTVALLQGCVQRAFFGQVNEDTARVLAAEGWDVAAPRDPRCCGALQYHEGEELEARELAKASIAALEGYDVVAVNAAGCGSAMKQYGELLGDEPAWAGRADAFAAKVRDVSELLAAEPPRAARQPLPIRVVYHDACHLAHAQGIRAQPRDALRSIPELELLEPFEWEICCGSAGIYNLLQPEPAAELGRRKVDNLLAAAGDRPPDAIAAANPGCAMQMRAYLAERGADVPIVHPVELIRRSIEGRPL